MLPEVVSSVPGPFHGGPATRGVRGLRPSHFDFTAFMKQVLALALFLMPSSALFSASSSASSDCPRALTTLAAARDCVRPLLLFAPRADDPLLQAQMQELIAHSKSLSERDVAVAIIFPDGVKSPETLPFARLSQDEESVARRRFHQDARAFAVVLVGKDGGEKLQRASVLTIDELKRKIDGMPMRQEEMRQQGR